MQGSARNSNIARGVWILDALPNEVDWFDTISASIVLKTHLGPLGGRKKAKYRRRWGSSACHAYIYLLANHLGHRKATMQCESALPKILWFATVILVLKPTVVLI